MATADFLFDCLESIREISPQADKFEQTICPLCKNENCVRAGKGDRFAKRVATQPDRFFNPTLADPKSSRYAGLADFEDNLAQEMILAVANRRGDWVVPEIQSLDGRVNDHTPQDLVETAVQNLPVDEPEPVNLPPRGTKVPLPTPAQKVHRPVAGNTSAPSGGIMIGGAPAPPKQVVDPWAPPPESQGVMTKPGARIQFGADGSVTVLSTEPKKP